MKVPPGWNPIFWKKYGRAIPLSVPELPRCLEKVGAATIEIKPRKVGGDTEGFVVGKEEIPIKTLEDAIIVGMEIQARQ